MADIKDLGIIDKKSLEQLVGSFEYLCALLNKEVKPLAQEFSKASDVRISLNKLHSTLYSFNDDIAAKVKMGSANEIIVILNEIADRIEHLGESLTGKYQMVVDLHQKELLKVINENIKMSQEFEKKLSSIILDRARDIDISKIEKVVEDEIKRKLGNFRFEEMDSLIQLSKLESHLVKRIKIYDKNLQKIEEHAEKMQKTAEWNQEHIAVIEIKYILGALVFGIVTGYTKLFYMFG